MQKPNRTLLIVTHDSDFGALAINEGSLCYSIFYMRFKNLGSSNIINVFEKLFVIDQDITEGVIIVVEDSRLRIRTIT